ncbi:MAG: hypothetical protein H6732_06240 [Alphaproteobacteria bacterium]|nr:hypothetical protein [Alphaproteobacteria bacterium]
MGKLQRQGTLLALTAAGCAPPPPGPRDLTETMRAFWRTMTTAEDEELLRYLTAAVEQVDAEELEGGPVAGTQLAFRAPDLEVVDFHEPDGSPRGRPDPDKALPAYLLGRLDCTVEQFLDVIVTDDQNAAYGSVRNGDTPYEAYSRKYHTSKRDFRSGASRTMSWEGSLTTYVPLAGTYVYDFRSDARRVAIPDDLVEELGLGHDEFVMTRTWLPYPAAWEGSSTFDQDYQLEVVIPWTATEVVKIYPVWREWSTPLGDFGNGTVIEITLGQMRAWDESTQKLCQGEGG